MKSASYSVYKLYGRGDLLPFHNKPISYFRDKGKRITSSMYHMLFMKDIKYDATIFDIEADYNNSFPDKRINISDFVLVNRDSVLYAYFCDGEDYLLLEGFMENEDDGSVIDYDTRDFIIKGYEGHWYTCESLNIMGKNFYLMENEEFKEKVAWIILDERGTVILDKVKLGFMDDVISYIKDYIKNKPKMENWQKAYENGEYLRTAEMVVEANYNMIDGIINNKKPSVLKMLKEKQKEVREKYDNKANDEVLEKDNR